MKWLTVLLTIVLLSAFFALPTHQSSATPDAAIPFLPGFPKTKIGTMAFGSPTVIDLNGDDSLEILAGGYGGCVRAWHADGSLVNGFPLDTSGTNCSGERINGPLAAADIDNDGQIEIVAATRGLSNQPGKRGKVFAWHASGSLLPGWPKEMDWNSTYGQGRAEVYSVALAHVLPGNMLQIIAGTSNNAANGGDFGQDTRNLYVWNPNGSLVAGFPTWYRTAGIWGQVAAVDITGDNLANPITGRDQIYLHAYDNQGQPLSGWPVRTYVDITRTTWDVHPYLEFTRAAPAIGDVNRDGTPDIVAAGHMRNPATGHQVTAAGVLVLEPDGSRLAGWEQAKLAGAPLASDYDPSQAPTLADLNGNGDLEIIVPFFDGVLRVYHPDGSLWWQYDYARGHILYASEVAVGDVTGDGSLDLVFGTYSPDGSANAFVGVHALSANGTPLNGFPLALSAESGPQWGVRAAPTLTDLDGDCDVEIAAASMGSTLYVWDLPAHYYPNRMPWPTSRQNNLRNGNASGPALGFSACPFYMPPEVTPRVYLPFLSRP
ncbi:MAG: hypothetical protein Fur0018_17100 [Anaerolineales bacterium]